MSERMVLTIGIIPADCESDFISIGDPDASGTKEVDFEITGGQVKGIGNNFSLDATGSDWFDVNSPIFSGLATAAAKALGASPASSMLAHAWALFQWELEEDIPELVVVCEEDDGGEFANSSQQYNGRFFLRYYMEEDGETFGERAIVIEG